MYTYFYYLQDHQTFSLLNLYHHSFPFLKNVDMAIKYLPVLFLFSPMIYVSHTHRMFCFSCNLRGICFWLKGVYLYNISI